MINGTYRIVMKTLMGKKYGRLTLYETENALTGTIDILGHQNTLSGERLSDGKCRFSGELVTPVRTFIFTAEGEINETQVNILIFTDKLTMSVSGEIEAGNSERG